METYGLLLRLSVLVSLFIVVFNVRTSIHPNCMTQTKVNDDQKLSPQGIIRACHFRMNPIPPKEIVRTGVLVSTGGQCLPIETGAHCMSEEEGEEESGQFNDPSHYDRSDSSFVV